MPKDQLLSKLHKIINLMQNTIKIAALIILSLLHFQTSQAQCHIDDWTALKALYESTDGDSWNDNDGWQQVKTDLPPLNCNLGALTRVVINESDRVKGLQLSLNKLKGSLPVELGNLDSLVFLGLKNNLLKDSIPSSIGNLSKLKYLYLGNLTSDDLPGDLNDNDFDLNQFSGSIPTSIGKLNNLIEFDLCSNQISGSIPSVLGNLVKLTYLNLSENELNDSIPSQLSNLNSLVVLDLSSNNLGGNMPSALSNLSNLVDLDLSSNNLSGNIPSALSDLSNLERLDLSSNNLIAGIPSVLSDLSNLTELNLSSNNLSGTIPSALSNLSNLIELDLSSNNLIGGIPSDLASLNNIVYLILSNNNLEGEIPPEIGTLSSLTSLEIANNNLIGTYEGLSKLCEQMNSIFYDGNTAISLGNNFDCQWETFCENDTCVFEQAQCDIEDWKALKALYENTNGENWINNTGWEVVKFNIPPDNCDLNKLAGVGLDNSGKVDFLNLSYNGLNGDIPAEIGNLSHLTSLLLINNELSGSIPASIGKLNKLTELLLDLNKLNGSIPVEIGNLSNLHTLRLNENELSGIIPESIGKLSNLSILWLQTNELTGSIPNNLGNLSNLTDLSLQSNKLDGGIPIELGKLRNLEFLWLQQNNITGNIPAEIGNIENLGSLWLQNNKLNGSIPAELGLLTNLISMWISDNKLSGSIPAELGQLTNLENLRLNNNELSGNIPVELSDLNMLSTLELQLNQLSGVIPAFSFIENYWGVPSTLNISNNYFTCSDISTNLDDQEINEIIALPQNFVPLNYDSLKVNIYDTISTNQALIFNVELPWNNVGDFSYQWKQNNIDIPGANQPTLTINNITLNSVGEYTLRVESQNCLTDGSLYVTTSESIYVFVKGYDLYGQPVVFDQIMVEFDTAEERMQFEDEILFPNTGFVKKACNCNRELYLWQFPTTKGAVQALLEIDRKTKSLKKKSNIDGDFNNLLQIGETESNSNAYKVVSESLNMDYPDSVLVFILDSGLDDESFDIKPFLIDRAPVDGCYDIDKGFGYSYIDSTNTTIPVSTNYQDDLWHGTYGFRSITENLTENHPIKVVPLKIFDKDGTGNLFNLTCALFHAIDHQADIVNISAGYQGQPSEIFERAINYAREEGTFITAAAGNESINGDTLPQYPAYYAGQYHTFETSSFFGGTQLDSVRYENVISVTSINENNQISQFANFGKQSITIAAPGDKILSYGLGGAEIVASGTSMSTYFVTKELALEIASNKGRTPQEIWNGFEQNRLVSNDSIIEYTRTGMQLKVRLDTAIIQGCTDKIACNYFEFASIDDGTCEYESCITDKCHPSDWDALKSFYQSTNGDNWNRNDNWELLKLNEIPANCNFEDLYGIWLNTEGRVDAINLYNNNLSGSIPSEIETLTELTGLYLAANNLEEEVPQQLTNLLKLSQLILSANSLSGEIPVNIDKLKNLKRLHLSHNQLTGEIPTNIGQLTRLEYLSLDYNLLEGSMPKELAQLKRLYNLYINHNLLSGCFENELTFLCDLPSPQFKGNANISENNFVIIQRRITINLDKTSFLVIDTKKATSSDNSTA